MSVNSLKHTAALLTALLSVIMVVVCMDQFRWRDAGLKPLIMLVLIVGGIVLCCKTAGLDFSVLFRAEHFAAQAVCGGCRTYGVIEGLSPPVQGAVNTHDANGSNGFKVRCRKCRHDWTMSAMHTGEANEKYL